MNKEALHLLDYVQTCRGSIKNLNDIKVQSTTKGNWVVLYKGNRLFTLQGSYLSDATIEKYCLR